VGGDLDSFPESSFFFGGEAEGSIVLESDGTLSHFLCQGTVPDLGLWAGAHHGYTSGVLDLRAGDTTVTQSVVCDVIVIGSNGFKLSCR
jgi:hypothetical protein